MQPFSWWNLPHYPDEPQTAVRRVSSWLEPSLVVLLLKQYYTSNMEQNKDRKILSTNTRYPAELRESLLRLAKKQKRSFNAEVMWALQM